MSEFLYSRRSSDKQHSGLALQVDLEVKRLLMLPRADREIRLQQQMSDVEAIRSATWNEVIGYLQHVLTKDALLFPDEDSPLVYYPSVTFATDHYVPVNDYFVRPKVVSHKKEHYYDKFRDFLGDSPGDTFEDIDFIKSIPGLAVAFSFYARTDIEFSQELSTLDFIAIDSEGIVVIPDKRLDFTIANPEPFGVLEHLSVYTEWTPEYELQFRNIYLFTKKEKIHATLQADLVRQLVNNRYECVDDFGVTAIDGRIPLEEKRHYSEFLGTTDTYFPDGSEPTT
jgi:hypothetical protein